MKNALFAFAVILSVSASAAIPEVTVGSWKQNSKGVTVTYSLSAPAIVTADIQTNAGGNVWVSIGPENYTNLTGDVNCKVDKATGTLFWPCKTDWPGQTVAAGCIRAAVTAWPTNSPPDYMVVDTFAPYAIRYFTSTNAMPRSWFGEEGEWKKSRLVMRRIPAAGVEFRMDKSPSGNMQDIARRTVLTHDFYMGIFELTDQQFRNLCASGNGTVKPKSGYAFSSMRGSAKIWPEDGHEVDPSSALQTMRTKTGVQFDLPTEAQWEFACRAGTQSMIYSGSYTEANVAAIAQCASHREANPSPVGKKLPNAFGLYDMIGNAAEFCLDQVTCVFAPYAVDPEGPETSEAPGKHLLRGGNSNTNWNYLDASVRNVCLDSDTTWFIGYRLVAPVEGQW